MELEIANPSDLLTLLYDTDDEQTSCDLIVFSTDEWFQRGEFYKADALLANADLSRLSTTAIVGLACSTFCAQHEMTGWAAFRKRADVHLRSVVGSEKTDALLIGLDPVIP